MVSESDVSTSPGRTEEEEGGKATLSGILPDGGPNDGRREVGEASTKKLSSLETVSCLFACKTSIGTSAASAPLAPPAIEKECVRGDAPPGPGDSERGTANELPREAPGTEKDPIREAPGLASGRRIVAEREMGRLSPSLLPELRRGSLELARSSRSIL